ncbi:MAG TPA: M48 family metalloprotease [Vicinamibacterales bacterium]
MTTRFAVLVLLATLVPGCGRGRVPQPPIPPRLSDGQELLVGLRADADVRRDLGVYANDGLQQVVQQLCARLAAASGRAALPWRATILDVAAANAFALPGGQIYLTRGLLPYLTSDAELAAVIGHEVAHVATGLAARQFAAATTGGGDPLIIGLFSPIVRRLRPPAAGSISPTVLFGRFRPDEELVADTLASGYLARSGFDPNAVPAFLASLAEQQLQSDKRGVPTWLETHVSSADLIEQLRAATRTLDTPPPAGWTVNRDGYQQRVHGMVFGDNPRDGLVRGREFIQAERRFALTIPARWEVTNSRMQMAVEHPDEDAALVVRVLPRARRADLAAVARTTMEGAGFRTAGGEETTINGAPAFVGTWDGERDAASPVRVRAAFVRLGSVVHLLAGIASADRFTFVEASLQASISSFRAIDGAEADRVRMNVIDLYSVQPGDTWDRIARHFGGIVMPATLAQMNHGLPDPVPPGTRVKVVTTR